MQKINDVCSVQLFMFPSLLYQMLFLNISWNNHEKSAKRFVLARSCFS